MSVKYQCSGIAFALAVAIATFALPVKTDDLNDARYHLYAAKALENRREYEAASDHYRKAYRMSGDWTILFDLGKCENRAGRHGLALEAFRHYLVKGGENIDPKKREETARQLQDLGLKIGYLNVTGSSLSKLKVDGISRCPPFLSIPVTAKIEHTISNNAGVEKKAIVEPTETVEVNFDPEEKAGKEPKDNADEEDAEELVSSKKGKFPLKTVGWITLASGAGALGASIVTGAIAVKKDNDLVIFCDGSNCDPQYADEIESRDQMAKITNILLITGGVLSVTGITLIILSKKKERKIGAKLEPSFRVTANGFEWRF